MNSWSSYSKTKKVTTPYARWEPAEHGFRLEQVDDGRIVRKTQKRAHSYLSFLLSTINSVIIQWLERCANHYSIRVANSVGFETVQLDIAGADLFVELSRQIRSTIATQPHQGGVQHNRENP